MCHKQSWNVLASLAYIGAYSKLFTPIQVSTNGGSSRDKMIMHKLSACKQGSVADANARLSDICVQELIEVQHNEDC